MLAMLILMLVILMLLLMLLNLNTAYADTDAYLCIRIMSLCCNSINLENVDFLEIGSQELNNMVMSVFEQSTAITQSSTSDLHNTDSGQITCVNKENGCPRYSFSNCKVVINDYGGKN